MDETEGGCNSERNFAAWQLNIHEAAGWLGLLGTRQVLKDHHVSDASEGE